MTKFKVHHLKKSQVLLQEVVVITADISYADFVPGMFFFWMAIRPSGAWFPNIPCPGVLANQSGSKSGGLRSAFGAGGLVFPSLIGVSTLNYWLWNIHLLQELVAGTFVSDWPLRVQMGFPLVEIVPHSWMAPGDSCPWALGNRAAL